MLLGFKFPAQGQLSGICSGRTELYLFPQTALLSRWDITAEVHPEWFSVCASCKVTILRFREDKQETGWFLGAGHLTGIPLVFKGPQLHLSLFSRWNKAILVSCLSHFSSWTGVHTWPFLEPVSASCLSSLSPAAPLTTVAITPWQLHAVPLSLSPLWHRTTNLGNTWIGCQPAGVVKVTFKLQLCNQGKNKVASYSWEGWTQGWGSFLNLHTCESEEQWRQGILNLKTRRRAIKKTFK